MFTAGAKYLSEFKESIAQYYHPAKQKVSITSLFLNYSDSVYSEALEIIVTNVRTLGDN